MGHQKAPQKGELFDYLLENFFNVLSAVFVAFLGLENLFLLKPLPADCLLLSEIHYQ